MSVTLYGVPLSPFVRKVRIVLAEKKLDYKFEVEDVWAADTTIATSNPLGKVPCLVMEGGEAVFDSRVIVEYVDTLSPVGKLIPLSGRERVEVRTWEALADGLDVGGAGHGEAEAALGPQGQPVELGVRQRPVRVALRVGERRQHEAVLHGGAVGEGQRREEVGQGEAPEGRGCEG